MSLGGHDDASPSPAHAPDARARLVLVDITPGVNAEKAKAITDFVNGPEPSPSFDELLARTIEFNPTRTESSLRRGILHNAAQRRRRHVGLALRPRQPCPCATDCRG